jgi:hypothetical protein
MFGLSHLAGRIILALMGDGGSQLSPVVQEGGIWRVRIAWPNAAVRFFGKFTSEKDAIAWIEAHPNLTKPVDTVDAPPLAGD